MSSPAYPGSPKETPHWSLRILSAGAGVLVLLTSALFTLGTALVAPLGMLAARFLARREGRQVTRFASWFGACIASCVALVLAAVVLFSSMPPETLRQIEAATDSVRREARAHPPPWVERMQRNAPPNPVMARVVNSPPFTTFFSFVGAAIGATIVGALAGSAGWLGTSLLVYAFHPTRAA